jgi:large subunit ribosomal protein L20
VPRVKRGSNRRDRRRKILAQAKGYYQRKSKLYRYAKEAVERGQKFAYIGRKLKKRDFRSLWIIRIGAAARLHGLSYSRLIHGLNLAGIELNRKALSEMAIHDPQGFEQVAAKAHAALEGEPAAAPSPSAESPAA